MFTRAWLQWVQEGCYCIGTNVWRASDLVLVFFRRETKWNMEFLFTPGFWYDYVIVGS